MARRKQRQAEQYRRHREALWERVHGQKREPSVAEQVRAEIERQRRAEEEARRTAEEAKFRGGPCCWCGVVSSSEIDEDTGVTTRAWYDHPRGQECSWCHDWRTEFPTTDTEWMDKIADLLQHNGVDALARRRRPSRWTPGLAEQLAIVPWCDSGHPPGSRWGHLRPVEQRLRAERAAAAASQPQMTWDDAMALPGRVALTAAEEAQLRAHDGWRLNHEEQMRRQGGRANRQRAAR